MKIPDKLYFRIGEVARITELKPHVLRYWETEFPALRLMKSKSNQRVYQRKNIETIFIIKKLLYQDKFTIEGARSRLKELMRNKDEYERERLALRKSEREQSLDDLQSLRTLAERILERVKKIGA